MGEQADRRLDGTDCEGCGQYIGPGDGIPRYCSTDCEPADYRCDADRFFPFPKSRARLREMAAEAGFDDLLEEMGTPAKERCHVCTKLTHAAGLAQHIRAKHPELACPHCTKVCRSKAGVAAHIAAKHPELAAGGGDG